MGWKGIITLLPSSNNRGWGLLSHTVGLERKRVFLALSMSFSWSPSHTVGSEQGSRVEPRPSLPKSPSHAVGLEQKSMDRYGWMSEVFVVIPHSGLGTRSVREFLRLNWKSPSHTVGLERKTWYTSATVLHCRHPTRWAWNIKTQRIHIPTHPSPIWESPSHTVGLELCKDLWYYNCFQWRVTIPHSGFKTPPKKHESQNFFPLKIETAHREGTLTHIQLPSWTRVPVEPSKPYFYYKPVFGYFPEN